MVFSSKMNDDQIIDIVFYGTERYGTAHKVIKTLKFYLEVMTLMKYDGMPQFGKSSKCQNILLLVYIFSHKHNVLHDIMYLYRHMHTNNAVIEKKNPVLVKCSRKNGISRALNFPWHLSSDPNTK